MGTSKVVIDLKGKALSKETKLIHEIYEAHGGLSKAAAKIGVTPQLAAHWRDNGKIPLARVSKASEALGAHPVALNFHQMSSLSGSHRPFSFFQRKWKL